MILLCIAFTQITGSQGNILFYCNNLPEPPLGYHSGPGLCNGLSEQHHP